MRIFAFVLFAGSAVCFGQTLPATRPLPATTQAADVTAGDETATTITFAAPAGQSSAIVVVPGGYHRRSGPGEPATRYPVVYLLHGYAVGHTRYYLKLREAGRPLSWLADRYGVIIVTPDGKPASWYLDAPADMPDAREWQIETMITRHLIPEVDRRFRTWAEPAGRAVTGLSMGGHGALYLAARHPELFAACSSLSGLMNLTESLNKQDLGKRLGPLEQFRERWLDHSVVRQVERFVGRSTGIMLDCGWEDPFFAGNRELHARLMELKIPHDYVERPGAHTWDYWINALPYHFQFLSDRLRPAGVPAAPPRPVSLRPETVDPRLPDDPYCVEIADMNRDGRPDILLTLFSSVVWYENPSWKAHPIVGSATRQNVGGVPYDLDADGALDVAIAADWMFNDTRRKGSVWWARAAPGDQPWPVFHIDGEPNIHRVRWVDADGDGRKELLVAPLKGIETTPPHFAERGVRLYLLRIPPRPETDHWAREMITQDLHVCHGAIPAQFDPDPAEEILAASFEGVHLLKRSPDGSWRKTRLCEGEQKTSPNRGSSEVALGRLRDGRRIIATIEPWHGNEAVVYLEPPQQDVLWPRYVLDETFHEGHAVGCADLDGDGNDEIVAGYRGANTGGRRPTSLKVYYAVDPARGQWQTHWIDEGNMATEDLKIADMNGDGRLDVIACGRSTRNLKIYLNQGQ